jgi:hypothetical protein
VSTKHINSWDWDIRVRERNLKAGTLTEKDVEKHVNALPDLESQTDPVTLAQPAIGGREDSSS